MLGTRAISPAINNRPLKEKFRDRVIKVPVSQAIHFAVSSVSVGYVPPVVNKIRNSKTTT